MKTKAILESNAMQDNELAANGGDINNTGIPAGLQQKLLNDAFDEGYDESMLDADLAAEQKASEDPLHAFLRRNPDGLLGWDSKL